MGYSPANSLNAERYRLSLGDPLAHNGIENAKPATGYWAPSGPRKR